MPRPPLSRNRSRRPYRLRITLVVSLILAVVALATSGLTVAILIPLTRALALQRWSGETRELANVARSLLDPARVRAIRGPSDFGSPAFRALQQQLLILPRAIDPVAFVYLIRLRKDPTSPDGYRTLWVMSQGTTRQFAFQIGQDYARIRRDNPALRALFQRRSGSAADRNFRLDEDYGYFMSGYSLVSAADGGGDLDVVVVDYSLTSFVRQHSVVVTAILAAGLVVALLMMVLGALLGRWLCRPLQVISQRLVRLGGLDLEGADRGVPGVWMLEIDRLVDAVDRLGAALQSFALYLPRDIVRTLLAKNEMARKGGEKLEIAILFSDIRDFTAYTERTDVELMIAQLNEYLTRVSAEITGREGTIDKFIGDAVMAFWGAPSSVARPAFQACATALAIRRITTAMSDELRQAGVDLDFFTRIGLHYGTAVVGNLGSDERISYTAIGDAVNLASRLESANKEHGTDILVSRQIVDAVVAETGAQPYQFRRIGAIAIRGKAAEVEVFSLDGPSQVAGTGLPPAASRGLADA